MYYNFNIRTLASKALEIGVGKWKFILNFEECDLSKKIIRHYVYVLKCMLPHLSYSCYGILCVFGV